MDYSQLASPHHRYQSSLEGITSLSNLTEVPSLIGSIVVPIEPPLRTEQRSVATKKFHCIINYFETRDTKHNPYNRTQLINLTHRYALNEESRDSLLRSFFRVVALSVDHDEDIEFDTLRPKFFDFADFLLEHFFLPLKASTEKTPQPTPTFRSAVQESRGEAVGSPARVASLRGQCLIRDHHRCVISRSFDMQEAQRRFKCETPTQPAKDDEDKLLKEEHRFANLEVAHILPHSLTKANSSHQLGDARETALGVLNMFDQGVIHLINGAEIDRPKNALTLTKDLHENFGNFQIFFESIQDAQEPHTYKIDSFLLPHIASSVGLPVTRTLLLSKNRTIDPPLSRLLAIHRAVAYILHLSAAGEYIDRLLDDMHEKAIPADGSFDLGRLVQLNLSRRQDRSTTCN